MTGAALDIQSLAVSCRALQGDGPQSILSFLAVTGAQSRREVSREFAIESSAVLATVRRLIATGWLTEDPLLNVSQQQVMGVRFGLGQVFGTPLPVAPAIAFGILEVELAALSSVKLLDLLQQVAEQGAADAAELGRDSRILLHAGLLMRGAEPGTVRIADRPASQVGAFLGLLGPGELVIGSGAEALPGTRHPVYRILTETVA